MPTFNIARAGSTYPKLARNAVPVGTIFKPIESEDRLGRATYLNVGNLGSRYYSLRLSDKCVTATTNTSREVAMVGKATINNTFYEAAEQSDKRLSDTDAGTLFIVKGKVNPDDLPIAFALIGRNDTDEHIALDLSAPGTIVKFRANQPVTVVGRYGITGVEV